MKIYQYENGVIQQYDKIYNNEEEKFEISLHFVYLVEEGIVISDSENGGSANKGISQTAYMNYYKNNNLSTPKKRVEFFTDEEFYPIARNIYYSDYWVPSSSESLPSPLCLVHFDTEVNFGSGRANDFLCILTGKQNKTSAISYINTLSEQEIINFCKKYIDIRYNILSRSLGQRRRDTLLLHAVQYLVQEKSLYRVRKNLSKILKLHYPGYTNSIKNYFTYKN